MASWLFSFSVKLKDFFEKSKGDLPSLSAPIAWHFYQAKKNYLDLWPVL